ncbi:MAG TPA: tRNA pseudouridine(55) synthase TruB [Actinocrinis sp.]|jgi:tRNA pseudouridine55 synthase|uniref:tRNA pseudouridine(55) synthase TruB n=1 Tax=Actinocrinis sp. TaxID=1920516 RepID=UPI002DDD9EC3|nr:tRNA pseudouridine(55) synthase TruB [Actinocrinis sp.]HEV3169999.1 tRNA pseudouridine(55) synthase TruB [Actinocrinis sp.]
MSRGEGDRPAPPDGLVIVDKPAGWTSHDVVGRMRRLAGTRRVGHAGTLDPMATGVLVLGVERATRLLGHLALTRKRYTAVIRLGQATVTDDAEGEVTASVPAGHLSDADIRAAITPLTGEIMQVPSSVSAIKVNGVRSYARVRSGDEVKLAARPVTVYSFDVHEIRRADDLVDVEVAVVCSSGTYIRALARDLGAALGVGGHLTALRRTEVGPYGLEQAHTLDELAAVVDAGRPLPILPLADAAAAAFPRYDANGDQAKAIAHGGFLPAAGLGPGPIAVFGPDGAFLALVEERGPRAKPIAVFV